MNLSPEMRGAVAEELVYELGGKYDGAKKNIIVPVCPFCAHGGGKYGIYVGPGGGRKRFGQSNCFHCNRRFGSLADTLRALGLERLLPKETAELDDSPACDLDLFDDEIDDSLVEVSMPAGYKRCFRNPYLKSRGWIADDYEYFPAGTTRGIGREWADYVMLEVRDEGRLVGYIARSVLSKEEFEAPGRRYKPRRYRNSDERLGNGFSKLLYNYDAVEPMSTHTVVLCEGPFDVVGLNRKLELYENKSIAAVATFGKKISREQMYKLQRKGVEQVVVGYDSDAKETTSAVAMELEKYFDVLVADIPAGGAKDWDEMSPEEAYGVFSGGLKTVREFNLS